MMMIVQMIQGILNFDVLIFGWYWVKYHSTIVLFFEIILRKGWERIESKVGVLGSDLIKRSCR